MKLILLTLTVLLAAGCGGKKPGPEDDKPSERILEIAPRIINIDCAEATFSLEINTNLNYALDVDSDWVKKTDGSPADKPEFTVEANPAIAFLRPRRPLLRAQRGGEPGGQPQCGEGKERDSCIRHFLVVPGA